MFQWIQFLLCAQNCLYERYVSVSVSYGNLFCPLLNFSLFVRKLLAIDTFVPRSTEMLCLFHIRINIFYRNFRTSWQYCSWELKIKLHISVCLLLPAHTHTEYIFSSNSIFSWMCILLMTFAHFMYVTISLSLKWMCSHTLHNKRTHAHNPSMFSFCSYK